MADTRSGPAKAKWRLPFALGIVIPFLIWGVFRKLNPPIAPNIAAIAKRNNYEPRTYSDIMQLMDKAFAKSV